MTTSIPDRPTAQPTAQPRTDAPTAPAGWYANPDDSGQQRHWDGLAWGVVAPTGPPPAPATTTATSRRSTTAAGLAHLSIFFIGPVLPAVLFATASSDDRETRFHAAEALNMQLTLIITAILTTSTLGITDNRLGLGFELPLVMVTAVNLFLMAASWVLAVYAATRALKGERWSYPIRIRFFGRHLSA
jgi:uncharacterized Tic20 family protein